MKTQALPGINFNEHWARKKTKAEFVKEHMPLEHIGPDLDAKEKTKALEAAYDELTAKPKEEAPK